MVADDGRDLVIVSDLHLSSGYDERMGVFHRNEDFFFDGAFARFLDHLRARARAEGRRWRLVILGDLFDFLQVELDPGRPHPHMDTSTPTTLAKLDRIAQGHAEFFAALGGFAADGFPVEIVAGNHDIELLRESTQERLRDLLVRAAGRAEAGANIHFHPWFLYVPGVVYAEHGHQYDEVNSFTTLLRPYLDAEPHDPECLDLPLGSYFVEYLFNRVESIDPFADNVRPMTNYLLWALQTRPIRAISLLGYHLSLLEAVLHDSRETSPEHRARRRRAYQNEVLRPRAAELGLPPDRLVEIDDLAAVPAMASKRRQLRAILLQPLVRVVPALAGLAAVYLALGRFRPSMRSFFLFVAGVLGLLYRERGHEVPGQEPLNYLLRAARQVHAILDRAGMGVPLYVFGHTHLPEQFPLRAEGGEPYYVNAGTWTPTVTTGFELLGARESFTFVQITRDPASGQVASRLMVWNDNAARPEMLPLLAV